MKNKERIISIPFILIFIINVLGGSASYMINPILPSYLVSRGAPMAITGFISSLMSLVALFGRPFSGAAGDRFNKKTLMIISYILSIICLYLYSIADTIGMVVFVRILNGIAFALSGTVSLAFGAEFIPLSRLGEGLSYLGIATIISTMIGPQFGDMVIAVLGLDYVFLVAAILYAICAILTIVLPYKFIKSEKDQFKFKLEDFFAFDLLMYVFLIGMLSVGNGILLYYLKDYGTARSIANITLFYTVGSIATMLTKPITGKLIDKKDISIILYPSFVITAIFAFMFAKANALPLVLVAAIFKSVGYGTGTAAIQTEAVKRLGIKKAGVASSTCYIGMDIGNTLGPTVGAYVISQSGYGTLFSGYTIILLLCIPLYYFYHKKFEKTKTLKG